MLLAVGFAFTSCSDDETIAPAPLPTGAQVFFSSDLPSTFDVSKAESKFTIPVYRANTSGAVTVPITAEQEEGSIYTVPTSVAFADGEESANIDITYNPDEVEYGIYESMSIELGKDYTTPYGASKLNLKVGATEWVDLGTGSYREGLFADWTSSFASDPDVWAVAIQKNVVTDGVYRLINPYKGHSLYKPSRWEGDGDYNMVIHAEDPEYVWVEAFYAGLDFGYGSMYFESFPAYYLRKGNSLDAVKSQAAEYFGQLKDGVITMPANSFLGSMSNYNNGGLYDGFNTSGMFAVALPGAAIADYSLDYEYVGRFIDTDQQYYVEGIAYFGQDIASAKAALVTEDTYESIYDALVAGTYEGAVDVADGTAFRLPYDESGTYYVLIVAFNAAGEVAGELSSKVKAVIEGGEVSVNWAPAYVGTYYYDLLSDPDNDKIVTEEGLALNVDADNESHYQIAPWGNEKTLEFIMNEDGSITVPEDQASGLSGSKGELFVADVQTYTGGGENYAKYVSSYSKGVFTLYLVYYNEGEAYIAADTFTITGQAEVKRAIRTSHKRVQSLHTMAPVLIRKNLVAASK